MTYLDSSVALAHLLAEDRRPAASLWDGPVVSSRLIQYEIWTRICAKGLQSTHGDAVRFVLLRLTMVELDPAVLARALEPFPVPVRTLDALHLATMVFLRDSGQKVHLASYDDRLIAAARKLGIESRSLRD